jgi:hypothetical protein
MALGEPYFETIRTSDGKQHLVRTCAVEPMTDIAVAESHPWSKVYRRN